MGVLNVHSHQWPVNTVVCTKHPVHRPCCQQALSCWRQVTRCLCEHGLSMLTSSDRKLRGVRVTQTRLDVKVHQSMRVDVLESRRNVNRQLLQLHLTQMFASVSSTLSQQWRQTPAVTVLRLNEHAIILDPRRVVVRNVRVSAKHRVRKHLVCCIPPTTHVPTPTHNDINLFQLLPKIHQQCIKFEFYNFFILFPEISISFDKIWKSFSFTYAKQNPSNDTSEMKHLS